MHEAREILAGFVARYDFDLLVSRRGQVDGLRRATCGQRRPDHRVGGAHLFWNPLRGDRRRAGGRSDRDDHRGAARVRRGRRSAAAMAAIVFLVAEAAELLLALVQEIARLPAELIAAIIVLADFGSAAGVLAAVVVLPAPVALEAVTLVIAAIVLGTGILLGASVLLVTLVAIVVPVAIVVLIAMIVLVATIVRLLAALLPEAQFVLDLLDQATFHFIKAAIATNRSLAATIARVVIHVIDHRGGRCGWRRRDRIGTGHTRREQKNSSVHWI